ncbi:MAG: hypothetical protein ACOC1F_03320 [Myxococcota bacterium]
MSSKLLGVGLVALASAACSPMSSSQEPVLAGAGTPTHIASDLSHVYVTTQSAATTTLRRVDTQRWEQETVCALPGPIEQLELAADHAYWLLAHQASEEPTVVIQKAAKAPNANPEPVLRSQQRVTSFAIDATHLYWSQAGPADHSDEARSAGILRAMDASTTPTNVVTRLEGEPHRITLGGAQVYWVTKEPDGGSAVMSWPKMGGDHHELLVLHANEVQGKLPSLAATDNGVYVLTRRELILLGPEGKQVKRVIHGFVSDAPQLVFDFKHLYFRTHDGLMRMNPDGSEFLPYVPTAGRFTVGADFVYWFRGNQVLRREK